MQTGAFFVSDTEPLPPREAVRLKIAEPEERARLLRLCRRFANGDPHLAEDLVQETLIEAWRQVDSLQNPAVWRSWLHGIARNQYLRWRRTYLREKSRRVGSDVAQQIFENRNDPTMDLEAALERHELAALLDRAMSALPPQSRGLLTDSLIYELPAEEIAGKLGISENATAVRLFRSKHALRRILLTNHSTDCAAYGLTVSSTASAIETRIWCPFCGDAYLQALSGRSGSFKMTCPRCSFVMGPRCINYPSDCIFGHQHFNAATVLGEVQAYKPALTRIAAYWHDYFTQGQQRGRVSCIGCGQDLSLSNACPTHLRNPSAWRGLHIHCVRCQKIHVLLPHAFAFAARETQQFWKQQGRIKLLAAKSLEGGNHFLVSVEAVGSRARLDLVFSGNNFALIDAINTTRF